MSIYKDQSGRWHGYVSMGLTDHGRRDRRHVSGRRRDDVLRKVRELERRRDEGAGSVTGRQVTVDSWLQHWLDTIAAPARPPFAATAALLNPSTWCSRCASAQSCTSYIPRPLAADDTVEHEDRAEPGHTPRKQGGVFRVSAVAGCSVFSRRRQADRCAGEQPLWRRPLGSSQSAAHRCG